MQDARIVTLLQVIMKLLPYLFFFFFAGLILFFAPRRNFRRHILKNHTVCQSVCYKSCLKDDLKTTEANLMKLYRKAKHNEKMCGAQELGPCAQGHGHNWVRG